MPRDHAAVSVLFAGLPGTGKTTYLALLYLGISSDRTHSLRLGSYSDDREYVNRIAKKLLACEEIAHTEIAEQGRLSLSLEVGAEREHARLEIPDLSGETWEEAVYERTWPQSIDQAARAATGTLVFVHVAEFDAAPSIATVQTASRALGEDGTSEDRPDAESSQGESDGRPQPTQVQIVDLLQLLCEERSDRPARAGIVLSAWDLTDESLTPREWLATNAPLADQYLRANEAWLEAKVWGVSAQGGNFKDNAQREALLKLDAIDRARILDGSQQPCPSESPMLWVMRADKP